MSSSVTPILVPEEWVQTIPSDVHELFDKLQPFNAALAGGYPRDIARSRGTPEDDLDAWVYGSNREERRLLFARAVHYLFDQGLVTEAEIRRKGVIA